MTTYWNFPLSRPINTSGPRAPMELETLRDASRYLAEHVPGTLKGEGASTAIRSVLKAASTGEDDDILVATEQLWHLLWRESLLREE